MTKEALKEKLENLKTDCNKRLNEKEVFTELVCNYVDANQSLNDDYTPDAVAVCYDLHFFVDDGEESIPLSLSIKLDVNGEVEENADSLYDEFYNKVIALCESIESSEDPRKYINEQIQLILDENITGVERLNKNTNTMLFAALLMGIVILAWVIYLMSRG